MRIDSTTVGNVVDAVTSERASVSPPASSKSGDEGDAVVVSPGATAHSEKAGRDQAAAAERLAQVRAAIKAGAYKLDLDKLAQKIVEEEMARRS